MEIWKDIAGYEGLYQVSNLGRVRSFYKGGRIRKPSPNKNGYLGVPLYRDGKQKSFKVHRLVAIAFIPNPENKPEVDHKNNDKTDNRVENLEWATDAENHQHAADNGLHPQGEDNHNAGLTNKQAQYVRDNPDNLSIAELAEKLGVTKSTISEVQIGDTYKNAGGKIRSKIDKRIPDEKREQIRREYKSGVRGCSFRALARKYNVSQGTVLNIVREGQPMNTSCEPSATTEPQDTGSPIRPAGLPLKNTVSEPDAITPPCEG